MSAQKISFPARLTWLNTKEPLTKASISGKILLVYFWSCSSEHSLSFQRQLKLLENRFSEHLLILGIHQARHPFEENTENLGKMIGSLHLRHPVAQDNDHEMAGFYGIDALPSFFMVDVDGEIIGVERGEFWLAEIEEHADNLIEQASLDDKLSAEPLPALARTGGTETKLNYPHSILRMGPRFYISESGRNRVLELAANGAISRAFGSATPGSWDGLLDDCAMDSPGDMTSLDGKIYFVDKGSHAIRRIDVMNGEVTTLFGNGKSAIMEHVSYDNGKQVSLHSPAGLCKHNASLFVAMRGNHQIWRMSLDDFSIRSVVGFSTPGLANGKGQDARLNQPSGIDSGDEYLWIADSGNHAIRRYSIRNQTLETLCGGKPGFKDGTLEEARFANPADVCVYDGLIYVADSYNARLRVIDPKQKSVSTLLGPDVLAMPVSVNSDEESLYVVDSLKHQVIRYEPESHTSNVFEISGEVRRFSY